MAKFLGVISNSAPRPSNDRVLEFTDLELLADFLFNETQNLLFEFSQKVQFSNEREILIHENYNKLTEIHNIYLFLVAKTLEIEQDLEKVTNWLCEMEKSVNLMEKVPNDYGACKCTMNFERNRTLDMLVQMSKDIIQIDGEVNRVVENENTMPVKNPCDLHSRLLMFLEMHVQILEQIEVKACKLTDMLHRVVEIFTFAHKKIMGDCYHKPSNTFASDC